MRKLKSIMLASAMLLATPMFFSSCHEDAPNLEQTTNVDIINDFSKIVEAINNGAIKNEEAIGKLTAAIDKMNSDQSAKLQAIIEAINSVNNTLDAKLALIEAAMKAQTLSLEGKLDLLEQAIKNMPKYDEQLNAIVAAINALPNYKEQLKAIETIISSVNTTLSTKLAAIEAIIKAQTLSMEGKFDALEAAIKAIPDNSAALKDLKSEIANLIQAVKNGSKTQKEALDEIIKKLEELKGSLGTGSVVYSTEYVDLGLPSGTLWAKCNLGAGSPEMIGEYYAWGETGAKTLYTPSNYAFTDGSWGNFTKYSIDNYFSILQAEDDVATQKLGAPWHMPTTEQTQELQEKCQFKAGTYNGVKGAIVTGPNGNEIFFPFAGQLDNYQTINATNSFAFWKKDLYSYDASKALCIFAEFVESGNLTQKDLQFYADRYLGMQVRAVRTSLEEELGVVDLGLPSGTLWAKCNLGADKPEALGGYYAWGETTPKESFTYATYKWLTPGLQLPEGVHPHDFYPFHYIKYQKEAYDANARKEHKEKGAIWYDKDGNYIGDGKRFLNPEDDAATCALGEGWRIPTYKECSELMKECTVEDDTQNGVQGVKITGKNNKSIFIPNSGFRSHTLIEGEKACISANECSPVYANLVVFKDQNYLIDRYVGIQIRPVYIVK